MLKNDFGLNVLGEYEDGESGLAACIEQRPDLLYWILRSKAGRLTVFNRLKDRAPDLKSSSFSLFHPRNCQKHRRTRRKWSCSQGQLSRKPEGQLAKSSRERFTTLQKPTNYSQPRTNREYTDSLRMITPRETDVLQMVDEGYSSKEIAQAFGLSVRTIDAHRLNMSPSSSYVEPLTGTGSEAETSQSRLAIFRHPSPA